MESQAPWVQAIRREILDPLCLQAQEHPFNKEILAGTLPQRKLLRRLADLLWVIVSFPETIAGLAARCPRYDHEMKRKLVANAYEELTHPQALAKAVNALGGDGDAIIAGPEGVFKPFERTYYRYVWSQHQVFHAPWPVA